MAINSNSKSTQTIYAPHFGKSYYMGIVMTMLWIQYASGMIYFTSEDICGIEMYGKPQNCSYGSYMVNPDTRLCADREICYLGLGEPCKPNILEIRCARGLACKCGRCMNCMGGDCNMEVWCQRFEAPKRWISPYERNLPRLANRIENPFN